MSRERKAGGNSGATTTAPATAVAAGKRTRTEALGSPSPAGSGQSVDQRWASKPASQAATGDASSQRAGDWVMDAGSLSAMGLEPDQPASPDELAGGQATSPESQSEDPDQRSTGADLASSQESCPSTGGSLLVGTVEDLTPPLPGINRIGFVDHSDGSYLRAGPAETGAPLTRSQPLPPATRVFVSGVHPQTAQWWYVTAFLPEEIVRGYVQDLRITTELPEPSAKLHQLRSGDTVERLAVQEFASAVRDGHDLRYYENVLLKVNRDQGRAGITGSYQAPGALGGGANNIQLLAGHRIWLVSPAYARSLEDVVPDGSLTHGAYGKVKRFAGHLQDLLASVTRSPAYLDEVAGDLAQSIRDHMAEIVGLTAAFLVAESVSIAAAASPTALGQVLALIIQALLALFGAHGLVQAGGAALEHGRQWMSAAGTATGDDTKIAAASREFLSMLLALALAALAFTGTKGSATRSASILAAGGRSALLPALAEGSTEAVAGAGVQLGPPNLLGGPGASAGMMMAGKEPSGEAPADSGTTLTGGGRKVLRDPALQAMKDRTVAEAITARGGGAGQVNRVSSDLRGKSLAEVANLAAQGDQDATTAIKLVKQASAKAQKYGGKQ